MFFNHSRPFPILCAPRWQREPASIQLLSASFCPLFWRRKPSSKAVSRVLFPSVREAPKFFASARCFEIIPARLRLFRAHLGVSSLPRDVEDPPPTDIRRVLCVHCRLLSRSPSPGVFSRAVTWTRCSKAPARMQSCGQFPRRRFGKLWVRTSAYISLYTCTLFCGRELASVSSWRHARDRREKKRLGS